MTSKNLGGLLMKIVLFIGYYFSNNWTVFPFATKILKKHLLMKVNIRKNSLNIYAGN